MRMATRMRALGAGASLVMAASAAAAHPGHGLGGDASGWLHYLTEPLHVAPLALAAVAGVLVWRRRRSARALACTRARTR